MFKSSGHFHKLQFLYLWGSLHWLASNADIIWVSHALLPTILGSGTVMSLLQNLRGTRSYQFSFADFICSFNRSLHCFVLKSHSSQKRLSTRHGLSSLYVPLNWFPYCVVLVLEARTHLTCSLSQTLTVKLFSTYATESYVKEEKWHSLPIFRC